MSIYCLRNALRASAMLGLAMGVALPAAAQEAPAEIEDWLVATVNGEEIRFSDVRETISQLSPELQNLPPEMLIPVIADQLATGRLIELQALEEGLDEDPEVVSRLENSRLAIMQEVWLDREIENRATEERIADAYEAYLESNPPVEQVRARHILVETEEEALALIEQLDEGADFATLARENSTGPTSVNGGDLGFFGVNDMVEPFGERAFALETGAYTTEPVQTQFGWHVILAEDRRTTEPLPLEDVREDLVASLASEIVQGIVAELREDAFVTFYGPDGRPVEESAEVQAPSEDGEASAEE